jgi:hypothetical protein
MPLPDWRPGLSLSVVALVCTIIVYLVPLRVTLSLIRRERRRGQVGTALDRSADFCSCGVLHFSHAPPTYRPSKSLALNLSLAGLRKQLARRQALSAGLFSLKFVEEFTQPRAGLM